MLKRFFEAKSFRFHVPKVIQVPKMIIFEYFDWKIMYVKRKLRIQGRIQIFEKMDLNRVLTLPDCRSRCQLSESGLRSQKGPLGAEL